MPEPETPALWQLVDALLPSEATVPTEVLDLGGGTGGLAVHLATRGHRATVVDSSPDALASLARRARDHGVEDLVRGVVADVGDLADQVGDGAADLVLCHGLLEHVDDPSALLAEVRRVLRPTGMLSLVVPGRLAAALSAALAGRLGAAVALLEQDADAPEPHGPRRYLRAEVEDLLAAHGLVVDAVDPLRVLDHLVPSAVLVGDPHAARDLSRLEQVASGRPELAALASRLHLVARPA